MHIIQLAYKELLVARYLGRRAGLLAITSPCDRKGADATLAMLDLERKTEVLYQFVSRMVSTSTCMHGVTCMVQERVHGNPIDENSIIFCSPMFIKPLSHSHMLNY